MDTRRRTLVGQPGDRVEIHSVADPRPAQQFGRFMLVGVMATVVSTTLFNYLVHATIAGGRVMSGDPVGAFVVANSVGMAVSYVGSRYRVFASRHGGRPAAEIVGFVAVNVVSWAVPLACLGISRCVLGLHDPLADNIAANVVGLGLGTLSRFWALRLLVFTGNS